MSVWHTTVLALEERHGVDHHLYTHPLWMPKRPCPAWEQPGPPLPQPSRFAGGDSGGVPPEPIPNSEVKPSNADGTAGVTQWESRSPPASFTKDPLELAREGSFVCMVCGAYWAKARYCVPQAREALSRTVGHRRLHRSVSSAGDVAPCPGQLQPGPTQHL